MSDDEFYDEALASWNRRGKRRPDPVNGGLLPLTAADKVEIQQHAERLRGAAGETGAERCELTTLLKTQCSHCKPGPARPVLVDGKPRLFTASFPGQCSGCDKPYAPGVTIERLEDGGFAGPCCINQT